jgi:hypothetical protein
VLQVGGVVREVDRRIQAQVRDHSGAAAEALPDRFEGRLGRAEVDAMMAEGAAGVHHQAAELL